MAVSPSPCEGHSASRVEITMNKALLERAASDLDTRTEQERCPRCVLLSSPELLSRGSSSGSDNTNTLNDFYRVFDWAESEKILPISFSCKDTTRGNEVEMSEFGPMIKSAFQYAFDPIRKAIDPESPQLLLWYYAGHGADERVCGQRYSATPQLNRIEGLNNEVYKSFGYIEEEIKGGELFLHHVGFCNLRSLIQPWIVAVEANSSAAPDKQTKNKHLVIILDSCHSGEMANDLEKITNTDGPWNRNCRVTVQASCKPNEKVKGGYFTPLFVYLNKRENKDHLASLEMSWQALSEDDKVVYRNSPGSSPSISPQPDNGPVLKIVDQDFTLNLFPDAGFFKFCYRKVSLPNIGATEERLLTSIEKAKEFLEKSQGEFEVVNYKLKMAADNTPLGLFVLRNTSRQSIKFNYCAHIHYSAGSTEINNVERINLVHHHKHMADSIDRGEDVQETIGKIKVFLKNGEKTRHALQMASACENYVRGKDKHKWGDLSNWRMSESYQEMKQKTSRDSCFNGNYLKSLNIPKLVL